MAEKLWLTPRTVILINSVTGAPLLTRAMNAPGGHPAQEGGAGL